MGLKPDILFWVFLMTRGALSTREAREKHLKRSKMMFLLIMNVWSTKSDFTRPFSQCVSFLKKLSRMFL